MDLEKLVAEASEEFHKTHDRKTALQRLKIRQGLAFEQMKIQRGLEVKTEAVDGVEDINKLGLDDR